MPIKPGKTLEIRSVRAAEVNEALRLLLAEPYLTSRQIDERVHNFRNMAREEGYDLSRQQVVVSGKEILFSCLVIPNAGKTAFILLSCPPNEDAQLQKKAVLAFRTLCQKSIRQGTNLVEILLEPDDSVRAELCRRSGFKFLTDLIYMSCPTSASKAAAVLPTGYRWESYDASLHELFKQTIKTTYRESCDCPELENLRDMEDVIVSHKSAGRFEPRCWHLLMQEEDALGVVLTSPSRVGDSLELVYMGLVPAARGKGLGRFCIDKVLQDSLECRKSTVILAVDSRNQPARRLYSRFGFKVCLHRAVYYYSSMWGVI